MYDSSESASQNLSNRRDRFRVSIRKEKLNSIFRARRDAFFDADPDPDHDLREWQKERLESSERLNEIAEGLRSGSLERWLDSFDALVQHERKHNPRNIALLMELGIMESLVKGLMLNSLPDAGRSSAALFISNIIYLASIEEKEVVQQQMRQVFMSSGVGKFLTAYIRSLLQARDGWSGILDNMLHLSANLIFSCEALRNEFLEEGITDVAIRSFMNAKCSKEHELVCWLISNIVRPFEEDQRSGVQKGNAQAQTHGFCSILMSYLSSNVKGLISGALQCFQSLVGRGNGTAKEVFELQGFITKLTQLISGPQPIHSSMSMQILTILASNCDAGYSKKIIESEVLRHVGELLSSRSESGLPNKTLRAMLELLLELERHMTAQEIDGMLQSDFWECLVQHSMTWLGNDLLVENNAGLLLQATSQFIRKLTFPQAQAVLRRVPFFSLFVEAMERFNESPTVLTEGMKAVDLTLMILGKHGSKSLQESSENGRFEKLLHTALRYQNSVVSSVAQNILELLNVRLEQPQETG